MAQQRPLVVLDDPDILDEILRIAAATGSPVERVPDVAAASDKWSAAPLVLVDEAALAALATLATLADGPHPPRGRLVLVCAGEPDPASWRLTCRCGVRAVVELPEGEPELMALLADLVEMPAAGDGAVLAVVGARGGAGASVFAAAAALETTRSGAGALLVDCDSLAGGLDLVLGAEQDTGLRWPDLGVTAGRVSMTALRDALPQLRCGDGDVVLLSCGRDGPGPDVDGLSAVLDAGRRAGYTVVCDLPRGNSAVARQVAARADLVAVVLPAEVRACAAARRVLTELATPAERVGLVIRGPAPDALEPDVIADAVGAEVLTTMRAEPRLAGDVERARFLPRRGGPLAGGAREVLAALARRQQPDVAVA